MVSANWPNPLGGSTLFFRCRISALSEDPAYPVFLSRRIEEPSAPYWKNRKLRPDFKQLLESGSLSGGADSSEIVSEDRSSRDETIAQ